MIAGLIETIKEQFTVNISAAQSSVSVPLAVKFDRYVYWLETKLLSTSQEELATLDDILDGLMDSITALKLISIQCRANMIVYNSAQVNRIYKMYEQIEALEDPYLPGRLFVSSGEQPVQSSLPDTDVLHNMVVQYRAKVKAIDEIASSKKNEAIKFKSGKTVTTGRNDAKRAIDISSIRGEVRPILLGLDSLSAEISNKAALLRYFGQIKHRVHFPLHALSVKLRSLPSLSEVSILVQRELDNLRRADDHYNSARRVDILSAAAQAFREAGYIENIAEDALSGIRLLANDEVYQVLCQEAAINTAVAPSEWVGADEEEDQELDRVPAWLYNLRRMAESPTDSILRSCASSAHKGAIKSDIAALLDLLRHQKDELSRTIAPKTAKALFGIDAELVCAFAADWNERIGAYEAAQRRTDFARAYEQLSAARLACERARQRYDVCMHRYGAALGLHREANQQLSILKERFVEIALSEVSEEIEFVA